MQKILDLTTNIDSNSPILQWAKSQDNPHIAMGHVGTHLDQYEKTNIPLEYFESRGILFDVRGIKEIGLEHIDITKVKEKDFVLFRTGQIEKYAYGEQMYFQHPELSWKVIEALIAQKVRFIGIDSAGIRMNQEHEQADRLCEKNGIYVIENLKNLEQIQGKIQLYTMWLDDPEMTGLRCRVIAKETIG